MLSNFRPHINSNNFILAVSGGVDSVVLLHILSSMDYAFSVVHYDHGTRENSSKDREFVEKLASSYSKNFFYEEGYLGAGVSEELARKSRYDFFERIKLKVKANLIVTAQHQDDEIETAMINILRGTGRLGLSSMANNNLVARPLIKFSKNEILEYAKLHKLQWVEDETNQDTAYLRNQLRLNVMPKMTKQERSQFLSCIENAKIINSKIDSQLAILANRIQHKGQPVISRAKFIMLDDRTAHEFLHYILTSLKYRNYDKKIIDILVVGIKTLKSGKVLDVSGGKIVITKRSARFYQ